MQLKISKEYLQETARKVQEERKVKEDIEHTEYEKRVYTEADAIMEKLSDEMEKEAKLGHNEYCVFTITIFNGHHSNIMGVLEEKIKEAGWECYRHKANYGRCYTSLYIKW